MTPLLVRRHQVVVWREHDKRPADGISIAWEATSANQLLAAASLLELAVAGDTPLIKRSNRGWDMTTGRGVRHLAPELKIIVASWGDDLELHVPGREPDRAMWLEGATWLRARGSFDQEQLFIAQAMQQAQEQQLVQQLLQRGAPA